MLVGHVNVWQQASQHLEWRSNRRCFDVRPTPTERDVADTVCEAAGSVSPRLSFL
ncbi:hypothetical protein GCM10010230_64400 [Streptomyces narbonensis]|nr:hypothetical protein GCM10010230_64400 [Streptomyces narbonensis]